MPSTKKNKSFVVSGSVETHVGFSIQVDASSVNEAAKKVKEMLLTKRAYSLRDFDGNNVDFEDADITTYEVSKEQ